jgi:hypothetical protein
LVSQLLALHTTPVVYLYLDRLSRFWRSLRAHLPQGMARPQTPHNA